MVRQWRRVGMRDLPPKGIDGSIGLSPPLSICPFRRTDLRAISLGRLNLASLSTSTPVGKPESDSRGEMFESRGDRTPAPPGPRFRAAAGGSRRSDRVVGGGPPPALVRGGWPKKCVHLGVSQDGERGPGVEFFLSTLLIRL